MSAPRCVLICAALLLAAPRGAPAEFPYPSNPRPCTQAGDPPGCLPAGAFHEYLFLPATEPLTVPDDFGADNWKYTSGQTGNPAIDSNPQELFGVRGASVDRAWQVTTGRPDVVIAVLDSGIRWGEPLPDLLNKFYLNRRELPAPADPANAPDPYDRNGDGVFTIQDYAADPRVSDQNGNGVVDPEDLIFLFSDGIDDDANGYVDDISGWDFFEDDNDPLDEVRYGHGTGESEDSGAEANNGRGDVGTCPNCLLLEVRVGDSFIADVNDFAQGVLFAVDSGARVVQEALGTLNQSAFGQAAVDYAFARGVPVIASAADEESNHNNYPATYNHTIEVNSVTRYAEVGGVVQTPRSYLYLNGCTNFGGHIALSVPSSSCSSEATGRGSGMAGLVVSAALNEIDRGRLAPYPGASFPLSANEIKQLLTMTADDINFDARPDLDPPLPQNYTTRIPVPGIPNSVRFPSIAGWDQYFGYGRVNADAAVRRVQAGQIPPEAVIDAPAWFSPHTSDSRALPLVGRVAAVRAQSYTYRVELAAGVQPREDEFVLVDDESEPSTAPLAGALASIDLDAVAQLLPHGTSGPPVLDDGSGRGDPERFAFTVRVRVTDDRGNRAEDRRTLFLHDDVDLADGYPKALGADGASPPVTADLDGDGREEIVLGTSNGEVHALRSDGSEVPGWPVRTDPIEVHTGAAAFATGGVPVPHGAVLGATAVGDLDRDGTLEVVAADLEGKLYAWNADGTRRAGFPVSTLPQYSNTRRSERDPATPEGRVPDRVNRHDRDNRVGRAIIGGPTLANLDGSADGSLEILAGAFDRHIYAWTHRGAPVPGWPVLVKDPAKVAAVDAVTDEITLRPDADAEMGTKILMPPSVGDLDGDGRLEVVAVANEEYREPPNAVFTNFVVNLFIGAGALTPGNTRVYAIHADGTRHGGSAIAQGWNPAAFVDGWPVRTALLTTEILPLVGSGSNGPPALADVDGDGRPEIATGSVLGPLYVLNGRGESLLGTHREGEAVTFETDAFGVTSNSNDAPAFGALGAPVLAEFAGAGAGFHLLAPAAGLGKFADQVLPARQTPADNLLAAWSMDGAFAPAFPRHMNDLQFFGAPAVADIDGDGKPEAIAGSGVWELHAFNIDGVEPPGWPKFTGGWMVASPAVGDLDGDGRLEVAAVTREGNLFVWRTPGDECGFIPWRRFHHDEWGTGNYATDARPPATVENSERIHFDPENTTTTFRLSSVPGDDLYCGTGPALRYDVRYATEPITDFAQAASVPAVLVATDGPHRSPGVLAVQHHDAPRTGTLHFALVVRDEAGNRSGVTDLGQVTFPTAVPTETPTPSASPTASATSSPTANPGRVADSGGCEIGRPVTGSAWPLVLPALLGWRCRSLLRRQRLRRE